MNPMPPQPQIADSRLPFYESAGEQSHQAAFVVRALWTVPAVSESLVRQWQVFGLPWIDERFDFAQLYERKWCRKANRKASSICYRPEYYAAAKLMDDQAWIDTLAETAFAEGRVTHDEVWEELRENGDLESPSVKSGEVKRETIVNNTYKGRFMPAATVLAIADSMAIKVPEHGIDFDAVDLPISIYRP
ncbi:MAG: hypothetical protein P1U65_16145 [Minwuia sp.]|nr:hypothetical protein [Minwuia sp.]